MTSRTESSTFTAVYLDLDGRRREEGLGTTNKREARRKAIEIAKRLDEGRPREVVQHLPLLDLVARYESYTQAASPACEST